jgi:aspartate/methionine/tyrosine aminotransferase
MLGFAPERTIVVGAASKEYLIPGARTAWIVSTDEVLCDQWLPRLIRSTSSSPNVLGQRLTLDMLGADVEDLEKGDRPRFLGAIKEELCRRRDLMAEVARDAGFEIVERHGQVPQGGISLFARLPDGIEDDEAFIDTAIALGKFSAIPGTAFGAPGCIRFGYAGMSLDDIERLRLHLREVVESMRPSTRPQAISL